MTNRIRVSLLAVLVVSAFAAPALAESAACTVNAPEIRLRKSPSKKAHVVAILKKDARVTAEACSGGWVKVVSSDGRLSGYVGGWALSASAPKIAALPAPAPSAKPEVAKVEAAPVVAAPAPKEIPSNEKLAIQITDLRLNVLGIERDMDRMSKEIQKIKISVVRSAALRRSSTHKNAAHKSKGHKQMAKR
jgi:hypothetical protein